MALQRSSWVTPWGTLLSPSRISRRGVRGENRQSCPKKNSEEDSIGNVAAPAAGTTPRFQTGLIDNPGCKLMMLSWIAGGGCRNLLGIIRRNGYHLVIHQEA